MIYIVVILFIYKIIYLESQLIFDLLILFQFLFKTHETFTHYIKIESRKYLLFVRDKTLNGSNLTKCILGKIHQLVLIKRGYHNLFHLQKVVYLPFSGGYEEFSALYPFLRTQKIIFMPKVFFHFLYVSFG